MLSCSYHMLSGSNLMPLGLQIVLSDFWFVLSSFVVRLIISVCILFNFPASLSEIFLPP